MWEYDKYIFFNIKKRILYTDVIVHNIQAKFVEKIPNWLYTVLQ